MGGFRFELEPVLRQREQVERERQVAFAAIDRERLALESELRAARAMIEDERRELRRRLGGGGGRFGAVREQAMAVGALDRRAAGIGVRLGEVLQRLKEARGELVEASADRRAIELLRERRYELWRREQLRREQRELDDIVNGVSARRAQEAA